MQWARTTMKTCLCPSTVNCYAMHGKKRGGSWCQAAGCVSMLQISAENRIFPLHSYIIQDMERLGFLMRGEIIWDKGSSAGSSTAWGSWMSASNPCIRDQHEYILVFSKDGYQRPKVGGRSDTIGRDEFLDNTRSVWHMNSESAKRVGHPAPFPRRTASALH